MSVRKAFKALIMRDYDTTNITLIRQLIKMVGSDYRSACRNRRQKQIYWLNNNQARDTTMKNLWKRQPRKSCQFKGLGDDPYRNYLPWVHLCGNMVNLKRKSGHCVKSMVFRLFYFFSIICCVACGYFLPGVLLVNNWK